MNVVTKTTIHDASTVVATCFGVTSSLYLRCKEIARKRSTPMKVTVMNEALLNEACIRKNANRIWWLFSQV